MWWAWLLGGLWIGGVVGYLTHTLASSAARDEARMLREIARREHLRSLGL